MCLGRFAERDEPLDIMPFERPIRQGSALSQVTEVRLSVAPMHLSSNTLTLGYSSPGITPDFIFLCYPASHQAFRSFRLPHSPSVIKPLLAPRMAVKRSNVLRGLAAQRLDDWKGEKNAKDDGSERRLSGDCWVFGPEGVVRLG